MNIDSRNIYLHDVALSEALASWHDALAAHDLLQPLPAETIPLPTALGRVTAAPVWAKISSPHYHASAMDGYAVRADQTRDATETSPLQLLVGHKAFPVDTGDPLPPGTDAVIKIEDTQLIEGVAGQAIEILASTPPWRHVRPMGEDMVATELVLPANHRLRPRTWGPSPAAATPRSRSIAAHASRSCPPAPNWCRPAPRSSRATSSNTTRSCWAPWPRRPALSSPACPFRRDVRESIRKTVEVALATHDLVVVNAGSSAGSEDFTAGIVAELGQLCVHGIAIRPGHPVILGVACGKAIAGIPGYPVSAAMTFDFIVRPLLYRWQGQLPPERPTLTPC